MPTHEQKVTVTVSVQLVAGRSTKDDKILKYKAESGINLSDAFRNAMYWWLMQQAGQRNFETDVIDRLDEIKSVLEQGRVNSPQPEVKQKFNNVFLDSGS